MAPPHIQDVTLYRVDLPLIRPYRLSYRTFESFEPILVHARLDDGREGWGEQHISPGSSAETREGGWGFARHWAEAMVGAAIDDGMRRILARAADSKVAATALATALEMASRQEVLETGEPVRLRLLTAFSGETPDAIAEEVESRLAEGFATFKIKVGKDVDADLARVRAIQDAAGARATLRIDANRAFSCADGRRFAAGLDPTGVALFEQPCAADDWEANAAVAAVSTVPLMLDEPICSLDDVDRAAAIPGVGLCKVKLKRFGSLAALAAVIRHIGSCGLQAVLGDGLGAEINCWMEARVADGLIDNAGEFNGYLKIRPEARLLETPLPFERGALTLPPGWWPKIDEKRLMAHCRVRERFAVGVSAPGVT